MTASVPAGTDSVRDKLDALDAALAKGYYLPWGLVGGTHDCDVIDSHGGHTAHAELPDDAALIVAAVNNLPALVAALRAVLDLHTKDPNADLCDVCGSRDPFGYPCATVRAVATDTTDS